MSAFAGTGTLARLALRRDRTLMPVWILVFVLIAALSASAGTRLYPDAASRVAAARAANSSPAIVAMYGRIYDPSSLGGIAMLKMTTLGAVLVAVLMLITVIRHTRAEEESGRLELLGAAVLGRLAPLGATMLVVAGASVVLGVLTSLGLAAAGLPASGAWAFGLSWACAGIAFGAVAAVAAQLTESARAATGLTVAVLGAAYLLRAIGDTAGAGGPSWLSWVSPVGWVQQIRPFGGDRWSVALVPIAFIVLMVAIAFALASRRDVGAGLLRPRPGPAGASATLRSPLALAWRLQRAQLLVWAVAFALLGAVVGSLASDVGGIVDSAQSRDLILKLGGVTGLTDAFLSTELGIMAVLAAAYGIAVALRLRAEETALRAEPLLATGITRYRWVAGHVTVALGGSSLIMLVGGLAAGLAHGGHTADAGSAAVTLMGAAAVRLPAVWVLTAIAVAVFGVIPRLTPAGWVVLVVFLLLGEFGSLLSLPGWAVNASPFAHSPRLPGAAMAWPPLVVLTLVAAALVAVGATGFRRRDVG